MKYIKDDKCPRERLDSLFHQRSLKRPGEPESNGGELGDTSLCSQISTCCHSANLIRDWTVKDVCKFVESIEDCKPYAEVSCHY